MNYLDTAHAVILYMTTKCNLACDYCFAKFNEQGHDTFNEILDSFPSFINSLKRKNITVVFFGGEPTLRWEDCKTVYNRLLTECKEKNLTFHLQTNGVLLGSIVDDIVAMEKLHVYISFGASKEHHDLHRTFPNGEGSWDIVKRNIDILLSRGLEKRLSVVYTYLPCESYELYNNVKALYDMGIKSIRTSIVKEDLIPEDAIAGVEESTKKIAELFVMAGDLEYHKFGRFRYSEKDKVIAQIEMMREGRNPHICKAGIERLFINTDGNIYICTSLIYPHLVLGNVLTGTKPFADKMESLWYNSNCNTCEAKSTCLACIYRCQIQTGSLKNTCPKLEKEYSMMHKRCIDYLIKLIEEDEHANSGEHLL